MPERPRGEVRRGHAPSARRSLPAVLAVVAAVLAAAVPAAAQDPATLTIVETATVRATPDAAELGAAVDRGARTEAAARRKVERRVRGLVAALQEIGVPAEAIRTGSFETYTIRRKGRRTSHALRRVAIRVDDLRSSSRRGRAGRRAAGRDRLHRLGPDRGARGRDGDRAPARTYSRGRRRRGARDARARDPPGGPQPAVRDRVRRSTRSRPRALPRAPAAAASRSPSRWARTRSARRSRSSTRSAREAGLSYRVDIMHVLGRCEQTPQRARTAISGYRRTRPESSYSSRTPKPSSGAA